MDATRRGLLAALAATGLVGSVSAAELESEPTGLESESTGAVAELQTDGGRTSIPLVVSEMVGDAEAVTLPANVRDAVGVEPGQQIRVVADAEYAAYTVRSPASVRGDADSADDATSGDESVARVSPVGAERFRGWQGCFDALLDTQVVNPDLRREEARAQGEYTEEVVAGSDRFVACAPHGGFVEPGTGEQARQVAETTGATAWYTAGYRDGGGAYDRWHITSTDQSRASYPRLDSIADRGFDRAVAFHGWGEQGVGIGGLAPEPERVELRDRITSETPLDAFLVREGEYAGDTESNVVNWLTASGTGGIQLEQSRRAREEFGDVVAGIVAELFG